MSLKFKLDSLDGLDESVAAMYEAKNGAYFLKVDGMPKDSEADKLRNQVESLMEEKKRAKAQAKEAEELARKAAEEKARANEDYETLAASLQSRIDDEVANHGVTKEELSKIRQRDADKALDIASADLAGQLADGANAKILQRFVRDRLRFEDDGIKITDSDGNLTVSTLDDLAKEFKSNDMFSGLIVATKGDGGGASGAGGGSTGSKTFSELTTSEKVELYRSDRAKYDQLKNAETLN